MSATKSTTPAAPAKAEATPEAAAKADDTSTSSAAAEETCSSAEASYLQKVLRDGLVQTENELKVLRSKPGSPFHSAKKFDDLNLRAELLKGVHVMGFNTPSKIQEAALPILLAEPPQNLIAQSQSGTGKTAAFVLAMLSRVKPEDKHPQVLCLSPTYELAMQTGEFVAKMAKFCPDIDMRLAVRGEEMARGARLKEHVIIGTPGKVFDWALKYRVFELKKILVFVLDEADVMIDMQGHRDQCVKIQRNLDRQNCQMMLFSATYDPLVMDFAKLIVPTPEIISLQPKELSLDNIKQYYVKCANEGEKYAALANIFGTIAVGQVMIFCQYRRTAMWLTRKMSKEGHAVALLTGEQDIHQRLDILDRYRKGQQKVLITTNILSRGIDIEQVTVVVNFDLPVNVEGNADCETYLHRIGRTGRFGKHGIAINLVEGPRSEAMCRDIEAHFSRKIELLNADDADEIEKIAS